MVLNTPSGAEARARAEQTYREYLNHLTQCADCHQAGVNCAPGEALRVIHREAKRATWPDCRCPIHTGTSAAPRETAEAPTRAMLPLRVGPGRPRPDGPWPAHPDPRARSSQQPAHGRAVGACVRPTALPPFAPARDLGVPNRVPSRGINCVYDAYGTGPVKPALRCLKCGDIHVVMSQARDPIADGLRWRYTCLDCRIAWWCDEHGGEIDEYLPREYP